MSSGPAGKLYTPELLRLAASLAAFPLGADLPLRASGRSRTCGSTIEIGLQLDAEGRIAGIGMLLSACAVGQASAAILATAAQGRTAPEIAAARAGIAAWLGGEGELPDWPGLALIEPARIHTGRHEALLLSWNAAVEALSMPCANR